MFFYHGRLDDDSIENQREYFEQLTRYEAMQEQLAQEEASFEEELLPEHEER